ncbi:outer membrane protein assembly factor BamB family protein [Aureliella helgolandensis]|uniref:Outer membrane biogenesis protein BamB n=1 Tax=Aureliella helgolandensis TaxID=2527968 RepID=A0A518GA57_9BACT|nr:PQQ-binding-like beta-propeller repeat protein [Aureliella helgolandensis]QDV25472.1 outer membrane biogenesis protein BamB [Aureliella helgolandensis]
MSLVYRSSLEGARLPRFTSVLLAAICLFLPMPNARAQTTEATTTTIADGYQPSSTDWPWWRGPRADGVTTSQRIPTQWSNTENILWKAAVPGLGHSSPIVVHKKIFLTTAEEEGEIQSLLCYELETGEQQWSTPLHRGQFSEKHRDNSHASATPASDGRHIFTAFGNSDGLFLSAVDMDGKIAWSNRVGPYPSEHGFCASVCIHNSLVFVAGEALQTGFIGAFSCATGEEVWRQPRTPDDEHANYATPVVVELAGRMQLILAGWHLVSSYDPLTGELIWENPGPADVNANCIAVEDPYLIVSGGYPQKKVICIKTDEMDGVHGRKVIWEAVRNVAWVPSPLIHNGRLLLLADSGVLSDLDLLTGEFLWTTRVGSSAYASPIQVDDLFMATTRDGKVTVFKSDQDFQLVSENELEDGGGNATPVVVDHKILIRTDHSLYCIGDDQHL